MKRYLSNLSEHWHFTADLLNLRPTIIIGRKWYLINDQAQMCVSAVWMRPGIRSRLNDNGAKANWLNADEPGTTITTSTTTTTTTTTTVVLLRMNREQQFDRNWIVVGHWPWSRHNLTGKNLKTGSNGHRLSRHQLSSRRMICLLYICLLDGRS